MSKKIYIPIIHERIKLLLKNFDNVKLYKYRCTVGDEIVDKNLFCITDVTHEQKIMLRINNIPCTPEDEIIKDGLILFS